MRTGYIRHQVDVNLPHDLSLRFLTEFREHISWISSQPGFACKYLSDEVFSKFVDPKVVSAKVRRTAAVHKWQLAELRNEVTNQRLLHRHTYNDEGFGWVSQDRLINLIRSKIRYILGPLSYPECLHFGSPTNGASTRVRKSPTAAVDKFTGKISLSDSALKHWFAFASGSRLASLPIEIVESSGLFTVPKSSEIDRVACKEPEGNMLLQRSLGEVISRRLKKFGIDLNDQTRNQRLASIAQKNGLATVDLSSASDLISRQLVFTLLPFDWWSILDDLRVKTTTLDKKIISLEMFSSMGNGFTFELESLIFYAITLVVARLSKVQGTVSVYGDDIICPGTIVPRLAKVLSWFGFKLNQKKSHSRGPFRESCGHHYWNGINVTPFYVKEGVRTLPNLINILNHLLEWDGRGWGFFTTEETYKFWRRWIKYVPRSVWGGVCTSDPSALVTGHAPRKRIIPVLKAVGCDEEARLRVWFLRKELGRDYSLTYDPRFFRASTLQDRIDWRQSARMAIVPKIEVSYKLERVVSRGERSAWAPCIAWCPSGRSHP